MNKTIYRIMGIIVAFALAFGGITKVQATSNNPVVTGRPVYAYYYLWWSTQHWKEKLGSNYPYTASPLPLPGTTDADGCNAVSNYAGNQLLDVPAALVSQDDPGAIEADIRLAKNAGITGFWLNWVGDGTTTQTRTTVTYTRRLSEAFAASVRVGGFRNWVSYKVASMQSTDHIINDLNFLYKEFQNEPGWERIDGKPVVTFTGSRKYSDADVLKVSNAVRDRIFLVGDETRTTLTSTRIAMFDAITYYWSSQDPWGNPQSFSQIKEMGDKVHAAGKRWYAPLNPGFNTRLLTGNTTCVPRRNGDTIRSLWNGNANSNPDGWGFISWNEIAENTHIKPLQKWGSTSLNVLASLIGGSTAPIPAPTATKIPPTATALPTLVSNPGSSTPVSAGKYDDTNNSWSYSGGWMAYTGSGPYNSTLHYTNAVGSYAQLLFTGTKFTFSFTKDSNRGSIDVYVDGNKVTTINANSASYAFQQTYTSPTYASGNHTVRFVHAGNGAYIDIDAIQIYDGTAPTAAPTSGSTGSQTLDDKNAAFAFSSGWQSVTTANAYGGSYQETTQDGATITLPFTGQSFSLIYKGGVTFSKFDVYVDGALVSTLDQKLGAATYQVRWDYPGQLALGNHTLKLVFKVTSATVNRGSLDAVIVR